MKNPLRNIRIVVLATLLAGLSGVIPPGVPVRDPRAKRSFLNA